MTIPTIEQVIANSDALKAGVLIAAERRMRDAIVAAARQRDYARYRATERWRALRREHRQREWVREKARLRALREQATLGAFLASFGL